MVFNGHPHTNGWFRGTTIFGNTHIDAILNYMLASVHIYVIYLDLKVSVVVLRWDVHQNLRTNLSKWSNKKPIEVKLGFKNTCDFYLRNRIDAGFNTACGKLAYCHIVLIHQPSKPRGNSCSQIPPTQTYWKKSTFWADVLLQTKTRPLGWSLQ